MTSHNRTSKAWVRSLPYSRPAYPERFADRLKYLIWRVISPLHPYVRDLLCYIRVLRTEGRQNFLLGRLAPHQSIETFVEYLLEKGFGNHFIAFNDDGQVVSLRYTPDFKYQYHVRIFHDGEVRGHYEYTPEYRPFAHFLGEGLEARIDEFLKLFGDRIVPAEFSSSNEFKYALLGKKF